VAKIREADKQSSKASLGESIFGKTLLRDHAELIGCFIVLFR
jgi:hypothetical protein